MTRVLSGIKPSGPLHLGNYLGAIRRWVDEQERQDAFYMVADLHAMTVPHDPEVLRSDTRAVAAGLMAAGLDPDRITLFVQSHVHEHAELTWLLNCVASMGELGRMIQYKEKSEGQDFVSVGLFDYPVLQAADILIYQADEVPVGDDQRQHVELTRDIAQRFNHRFGEVFTIPEATVPRSGARVMDLQDPTSKMSSSSESRKGIIDFTDTPDEISKKVMSAKTDSGSEVVRGPGKEGITNLLEIMSAATGDDVEDLEGRFAGGGYGDFKKAVSESVVELLRPIQERYRELLDDRGELQRRLEIGADKAREVASRTLADGKEAMGLLPPSGTSWR